MTGPQLVYMEPRGVGVVRHIPTADALEEACRLLLERGIPARIVFQGEIVGEVDPDAPPSDAEKRGTWWFDPACFNVCDACGCPLTDDTCPQCGVHHGDPCATCGRRGYHQQTCSALDQEGNDSAPYL